MSKKSSGVAAVVAAASVHEQGFGLKDLDLDELEQLREKVGKEIADRRAKDLILVRFSPPDDRSYGRLEFRAVTKHGMLSYEADLGHGHKEHERILLNGNDVSDVAVLELPDFGPDRSTDEVREECANAVSEWEGEWEPEP